MLLSFKESIFRENLIEMDGVKISVIVPVYNVEKYLEECLSSLIHQTLSDIEIICVNDGSSDNSLKIIQDFQLKDKRIKIINKENSGYGETMNKGLDLATGEYIGIVESDDFVKSEMFEELYKIASKNEADVVKSDFYFYFTKEKQARKADKVRDKKCFSIKDDVSVLKTMPSIWSGIYRREFLIQNSLRFLETPGASYQDTSFAFKTLCCAKKIIFTKNAYLYYRSDNENSSVKSKSKVFCICDEFDEITKFLNENPKIKSIVNNQKLKIQFNRYKWNTIRIDDAFRDEFIDKFQQTFENFYKNNEIQLDSELELLLKSKAEFRKYIDRLAKKQELKEKRRKFFSVRISLHRISIILFGKQIVEIG